MKISEITAKGILTKSRIPGWHSCRICGRLSCFSRQALQRAKLCYGNAWSVITHICIKY